MEENGYMNSSHLQIENNADWNTPNIISLTVKFYLFNFAISEIFLVNISRRECVYSGGVVKSGKKVSFCMKIEKRK